jgi:YjbE family integral membrane protein
MLAEPAFWFGLVAIVWVNLLLSGDNAVVIAMAARSLPPRQQKRAIFWGGAAAIAMRGVLTVFAIEMLTLPYLKLAGGLLLLWIGAQLLVPAKEHAQAAEDMGVMAAVRTILVADVVMSLDNVLGVAAAANEAPDESRLLLLVLGLALSIPMVIFGSSVVLRLMERFPVIVTLGAALLGWIAGEMMITDPAIHGWVKGRAEWLLTYKVAAVAGACLVVTMGQSLARRAARSAPEAR